MIAPATAEQPQFEQDTISHRLQKPAPTPENPTQRWLLISAVSAFILSLFAIVLVLKYMRRNKV